jgi:hypothetical protein
MASMFKQDELEQVKDVVEHWLKHFKGEYVDDEHNREIMINFIKYTLKGEVTTETLNQARTANYANLHGLGVAWTPEQLAAKAKAETDRKAAEEQQRRIDADMVVAGNYIKNYAPTGLICGTDFYGATSDKIIAFIKNRYPGQPLSNEQITEAIRTLWNSLDFFDRSDAALQFRNIAKPERKLSQQARIDAGLELPENLRTHTKDSALKNPAEQMRKILKKLTGGMEDPELLKADQISVNNRYGRVDHSFTADLRKIVKYRPDGSIDGRETLRLRTAAATEYERRRNRNGGQRG